MANPKNLLLAIAGATTIAATDVPGGQQAVAYAIFALVGTIGVATPLVIDATMGARAEPVLERLKGWVVRHNAVIMAVLCLVTAAKLLGDAVGALTAWAGRARARSGPERTGAERTQ